MAKEILEKVLSGLADRNIRFDDIKSLVADFGFACRIKGDHHIYSKEGVAEIINLSRLRTGRQSLIRSNR